MRTEPDTFGLPATALARLRVVLARHPAVERAVVYGSRARGDFRPASDIDLTLVGARLTLADLAAIDGEIDDLLLPWQVDLSLHDHIEDPALRDHIGRVGRVLHSAVADEASR